MSFIFKICIIPKSGKTTQEVSNITVIEGKGIVKDRYFKEKNQKDLQITLIESENIDYFNDKSNTNIPYSDFRRNIITKGIKLNELIGKEILLGSVRVMAHRLCDPCKYLQNKLQEKNSFKNMFYLHKRGGLRCEILTNGKIFVNDKIIIS